MLMKRRICLFICFLFFTIVSSAQSKIGYANPDEVFGVMKEKKQLDSMLNIFNNELQADYAAKDEDLQKMFVAFNKDSSKWNATTKAAKRILMQKKIQDLSDTQKKYDELLKAENERLMQPIQQKILKAIQDVAKENGYTIILYATAAAELNNGTDITEKVKKKLVL
jgi:outer membrane protein